MKDRVPSTPTLERALIFASLVLGLLHAWVGRYAMNPDGMSYLDVGDAFSRGDWANGVSAFWSPIYPWTVGLVLAAAKPSPKWEFPLVHLVNFAVFVCALLAFRCLLHALLEFAGDRTAKSDLDDSEPLPQWALVLLGYAIFLWTAFEVETIYEVTPDLAVMGCVCLTAAMLLRLRRNATLGKFAAFGLALGVGYWTKAVLLPWGLMALAIGYFWNRKRPGWGRGMIAAGLVFLCVSAPLIALLSQRKGRLTFGDSGKLAYAWLVYPGTATRNWEGGMAENGIPAHPTRQMLEHPPLYEFNGPVAGTYPPWTDPSYWNEGLRVHFKLKPQLRVFAETSPSELRLLIRARPELVAGVIALFLLSGELWLSGLREVWPLLAISAAGMGLYLPVLETDRYVGGFVSVLFLTLLAGARFRPIVQRSAGHVALAMFLIMALGTADYTVRIVTNHLAIPGNGPSSSLRDVAAAEQLRLMGARPGDKIAVISDGTGAYWAHLAKLRIVAEIMDANHGSKEFWDASDSVQQRVYGLFASAQATMVVTTCPPCPPQTPSGWERIEGTSYCVRPLHPGQ